MGNTRGLTDKPITKEVIEDPTTGKTVAAHLSTLVTDPTAANAVQIPDSDQYPSANATALDPLFAHTLASPARSQDPTDVTSVNEVQTLTGTGTISGGTYTITWEGDTTAPLAYNATAAQVKAALIAASPELGTNDITVGGGPVNTTPLTFTFTGSYAAQDVSAITKDTTLLTGSTPGITVTETTKGVKAD